MSTYYNLAVAFGWEGRAEDLLGEIGECASKAIELDATNGLGHSFLAYFWLYQRYHDEALKEAKLATTLSPNLSDTWRNRGRIEYFSGQPLDAISSLSRGIRLNPSVYPWLYGMLGTAQRNALMINEAIEPLTRGIGNLPSGTAMRLVLATIFGYLGRKEEAKSEVREILRLDPDFTVTRYANPNLYRDRSYNEQWLVYLREAGLPE